LQWNVFNEENLAVAITRQESLLFQKITPLELLSWNTKEKKNCVAVHKCVGFSNAIADWVTSEMVRRVKLEERVILLEKFINLGENLLSLKNFSSCMSVIGALGSTAIFRMKKTWDKLNAEAMSAFQRMKNILSRRSSYATYRAFLQGSTPPCLPYLGVCLSDLTFIDDGNKDENDNLFHLKKWQMFASAIDDFTAIQRPSFVSLYRPQGDVLAAFQSYEFLTEDQKHVYSQMVEPKDSEAATQKMLAQYEEQKQKIIELEARIEEMKREEEKEKENRKEKENEEDRGKEGEK